MSWADESQIDLCTCLLKLYSFSPRVLTGFRQVSSPETQHHIILARLYPAGSSGEWTTQVKAHSQNRGGGEEPLNDQVQLRSPSSSHTFLMASPNFSSTALPSIHLVCFDLAACLELAAEGREPRCSPRSRVLGQSHRQSRMLTLPKGLLYLGLRKHTCRKPFFPSFSSTLMGYLNDENNLDMTLKFC